MARKTSAASKAAQAGIKKNQLDLPVTCDASGEFVTLRDVMQRGRSSVLSLAALSPDKKAELTAKRIEAQPEFELAMVGGGVVSKERAIEEVKAQSDVGRVLIEIEQRVINSLLDEVKDG